MSAACSPPRWACRWCRWTRGCARTARAARQTCRTGSCRAGPALVVKGNFARSASAATVVRVHARRVELGAVDGRVGIGVAQRGLAGRLSCRRATRRCWPFQSAPVEMLLFMPLSSGPRCRPCCALLPRNSATTSPRWLVTLHVVDAMAALQHLLHALAGQHVAQLAGLEKFDAAAGRHGDLVVAVAGKGKGGVGQREDKAAVANLVAVEVRASHSHAQHGAAGLAGTSCMPMVSREAVSAANMASPTYWRRQRLRL
jgi:hypothetical protein